MKLFRLTVRAGLGAFIALLVAQTMPAASAQSLLERLAERRAALQNEGELDDNEAPAAFNLPAGVTAQRNIAYGSNPAQRYDVYLPAHAAGAPVIFMVHGGGWRFGDKGARSVVENKVARWTARGIIVVSVNYRMLPGANPTVQAEDVAAALVAAQNKAADWGGDRAKFVLMGHSAGAHLVAVLASSPQLAVARGATRWLGTVALDSAALDIGAIMQQRHLPLYDQAFGANPGYWKSISPYALLVQQGPPLLAVCSSRRRDSCAQARRYADKAGTLGMRAEVLPEDLTHKEINQALGLDNAYTQAVEAFMASLDPALAAVLAR